MNPLTLPVDSYALDLLDISPGDTLIDVDAGTGALAAEAARRGARVLATDIEPKMVSRATARLGLPPAKWSALKYGYEPMRGRTNAEEDPQA